MKRTIALVILLVVALVGALIWLTTPDSSGGSSTQTYTGPIHTTSLILVSQKTWDDKGKVRRVRGHAARKSVGTQTLATTGPCYRVDAEVHGDARLIDKVVQGLGHAKICMAPNDHTKILDRFTDSGWGHRESWLWGFDHMEPVTGAGVSSTWCNGGVGPCQPVEYRYWRWTFFWKQGVSIFGQDIAHHKTLFVACTLRAGKGGYSCNTGEA